MTSVLSVISWLFSAKGRPVLIFIGISVFLLLFLKQCNDIKSLKSEVLLKEKENQRIENNYKASVDTIRQSFDKKTGEMTATISGYQVTMQELNGKYANLFQGMNSMKEEWKKTGQKPASVIENNYYITEKIKDVDTKNVIDSFGNGNVSLYVSDTFSKGNSRTITGKVPYKITLSNKTDSTLVSWDKVEYLVNLHPGKAELTFEQQMEVYTGLNRNSKTGEITTWASTKYPGVKFTVLKGASVEDDSKTKEILKSARKTWGVGFHLGYGMTLDGLVLRPGIQIGVGINFTPKKLQFGK